MTSDLPSVLSISGGEAANLHVSDEDRALVFEVYTRLMRLVNILAAEGRQLILQTAPRTYSEHLDFPDMAAGPWAWEIKPDIPAGTVLLYSSAAGRAEHERKREGEFTVSSLMLPN